MRYEAIAMYIMTNKKNGTLHVGVTSELIKRSFEHRNSVIESFTQKYGLHRLVYYEQHATMEPALHREKRLKKYKREQKIKLIEAMNPSWSDLYETII